MEHSLRIFSAIATAIVLEAAPFLALGSLLSATIEVLVPAERVAALAPRRLGARIAVGISAGVVLPTCECGVVPVARRLLAKGAPGPTVVAYLLAAPIVNPVVLASTFVAFSDGGTMVTARATVAAIVAATVAFTVRHARATDLVRARADGGHDDEHAHDHGHAHGSRSVEILRHAAIDFLEMGKYLILGAFAAAAFKSALPASVIGAVADDLVLSVVGMMVLAVVLSVCSEADAFVAASFVTLPAASHLAFITLGPMVDLKLIALYVVTFEKRLFVPLLALPVVLVFLLSVAFGAFA